jgi:hypothetical protein
LFEPADLVLGCFAHPFFRDCRKHLVQAMLTFRCISNPKVCFGNRRCAGIGCGTDDGFLSCFSRIVTQMGNCLAKEGAFYLATVC